MQSQRNDETMLTQEITRYLEMTDANQLRPSLAATGEVELRRAKVPCPELSRFFYTAVGGGWYWVDRLPWTYNQWLQYLSRPGHETWALYVSGNPAGYFELQEEVRKDVEVASFGLLPQFVGQGLGGHLLTEAARRAWQRGATRVWLHTSSLDHPSALANYQARGFRLFKEETSHKELPERPLGCWPDQSHAQTSTVKVGRYRHYKGKEYTVIGVARHSETEAELVVYRKGYGDYGLWVRPKAMFLEMLEVDGQQVPRFEYLAPEE
jgi:ribosomal protein S18 acetylase RimI-like enzyme